MTLLEDKITLNKWEIEMISAGNGFILMFFERIKGTNDAPMTVYKAMEARHFEILGRNRYSNYDTFCRLKNAFLKNRNKLHRNQQ